MTAHWLVGAPSSGSETDVDDEPPEPEPPLSAGAPWRPGE